MNTKNEKKHVSIIWILMILIIILIAVILLLLIIAINTKKEFKIEQQLSNVQESEDIHNNEQNSEQEELTNELKKDNIIYSSSEEDTIKSEAVKEESYIEKYIMQKNEEVNTSIIEYVNSESDLNSLFKFKQNETLDIISIDKAENGNYIVKGKKHVTYPVDGIIINNKEFIYDELNEEDIEKVDYYFFNKGYSTYPEGLIIQGNKYYVDSNNICKPVNGNGKTYRLWYSVFMDHGAVSEIITEKMKLMEIEVEKNALITCLHANSNEPIVKSNIEELYNNYGNEEYSLDCNFIMNPETGTAIELFYEDYSV